jgi:uncharacterized protein
MLRVSCGSFSVSCREASHFFSRFKGLMFSPPLPKGEGLLFCFTKERMVDIHMLFVFFPLDIVWMDMTGTIVKIARDVKPFNPFVKGVRASYILEVPAGNACSLTEGDVITISFKRTRT